MKRQYLGIMIASMLSAQAAQADNLADAFRNGQISGDLNLFYKGIDNESAADSAYGTGYLGLKYETAPLNGLQLGLAFRHGSELYEKNAGDSDEGVGTLVTEAYLHYEADGFGATLGRQEIEQAWITDFHEALTLTSLHHLPNTELTAGYSRSLAVADPDDLQHSFSDIGDDGAYFLDAKISPLEGLTLNPYYLHSDDIFSAVGLKADFDHAAGIGLTAHYATSDVEVAGESDGDIAHLEVRGAVGELSLVGGYIATDKQGGIGHLDEMGETINPLEEGNQVYVADAKTWYLGAEYAVGAATLGLLYGDTDFGSAQERELDLILAYDLSGVTENLGLELIYAKIDANSSSDDYQKATLQLSYAF